MKPSFRRILLWGSVLLLPIALILNFFVYQKSQEEAYLLTIENKIHAVESGFNQDYAVFKATNLAIDSLSFDRVSEKGYSFPFFIVTPEGQVRYWSTNEFVLDFSTLDFSKDLQVLDSPYGTFLVKQQTLADGSGSNFFVQVFRLVWAGSIKNEYLVMGPNPEIFGNGFITLHTHPEEGDFQVYSLLGQPLFGIDFQPGFVSIGKAWNTPLLIFSCSIFLLYIFLSFLFLRKKWKKGQVWQALSYGFFIVLVVRAFMLLFKFPQAYLDLDLFEEQPYSYSWLVPSLGDLLLHTIGCILIVGLFVYQLSSKQILAKFYPLKQQIREELVLVSIILGSSLFFIALWALTRNLVLHADWKLDISAIPNFDKWIGISFLILFLWAAAYVFISLSLFNLVARGSTPKRSVYRMFFSLSIVLLLGFFSWNFWLGVAGLIHLLFLASLLRFDLLATVFRLGLETFLTLFYASLLAAGIVAASMYQATTERLIASKIEFANQELLVPDGKTALILEEVFGRVKNDLFIQNRLSDPLLSKDPIVSKIRKIYLDNYFDQFEVNIRIFSSTGVQIGGTLEGKSLHELEQAYVKSDFATAAVNIYFIPNQEGVVGSSFVAFVPISKGTSTLGTLVVELDQLRMLPRNAYPRLLLDEQYADRLKENPFSFGVFLDQELIRSSGDFNYLQEELGPLLTNPALTSEGIESLGYQHVGLKNGDELWVISSPAISINQFFGTFSLFFVVFVALTFFGILLSVLFQGYRVFEFNYSTKLQLYLNFAFFFPIVIISLITTGLLSQSYREDLNEQYLQKALLIKGNLLRFLGDQNFEELDRDVLSAEINTLATTVGTDIHLYQPEGNLIASSRATIFDKKLLANWMHPGAMSALMEYKEPIAFVEEQIGQLRYQTVYLALPERSSTTQVAAVLAVPFFESEEELNALISDVLGSVFNAFVVIFILFLVISFFVTKNLTLPFRLLTQKLKSTNLENIEPMVWASKDEIGRLVEEYNQMLYKLEASKKVLASNEKESAWREMAKQVAHEIKNPLTPMKLTLQHLLRLEKEGKLEDADRLKKSLETLIHQVDALSGIASSFSTFAKMPLPNNERINFKEVLVKVLELFKTDKRMELAFRDDSYTSEIPILGDDKLFGRIISNLIINGIQAVVPGTKPQIKVWLWQSDGAVFLEIADNGKGIPEALKEKIFIPNFSTKSQGSGLGLAIAKSGVETAGGKIWFESEVGNGSTFFLTFPLLDRD